MNITKVTTPLGPLVQPNNETITIVGTGFGGSQVSGTAQVETATVVGTIGPAGAGNATVIITSAVMDESPLTVSVAVANDDTASAVAGKIRTALGLLDTITDHFTVGGATANVTLTALVKDENDGTLNISIADGTCSGLTEALTSANTTAGVRPSTVKLGGKDLTSVSWAATSITGKAASDTPYGAQDLVIQIDGDEYTFENAIMVYDPTDQRDADEVPFRMIDRVWIDGLDIGFAGEGMSFSPQTEQKRYIPPNSHVAALARNYLTGLELSLRIDQAKPANLALIFGGTYSAETGILTIDGDEDMGVHSMVAKDTDGNIYFARSIQYKSGGALNFNKDFAPVDLTFDVLKLSTAPLLERYDAA